MTITRSLTCLSTLLSFAILGKATSASDHLPAKRPLPDEQVTSEKTEQLPPAKKPDLEPLWEAGIGGGGGWLPDYPAAGQNHFRGLGLPYVIYRGEFFQAGEGSFARGLFVNTDKVEFDLSFAGSLPTDSSDNDARDGLDDLDWLGEVGPSLSYYFHRDEYGNQTLINVALRAVLSTDFSNFDYVGLVFHPYFGQEFVDVYGIDGLDANWSIGARWADDGVMDLFYEVPVENANDERAAFDADPGYLGSNIYGAFSYPVTDSFRLAFFGTVASYHGAKNRDSDLFIDEINVGFGFGAVWRLWKSETLSKARP